MTFLFKADNRVRIFLESIIELRNIQLAKLHLTFLIKIKCQRVNKQIKLKLGREEHTKGSLSHAKFGPD